MLVKNQPLIWQHLCVRLLSLLLINCALMAAANAQSDTSLTLQNAVRKTLAQHPQLRIFDWRTKALEGKRQAADLAPAYELGIEAENVLGTGDFAVVDSAEITLAVSSVIELGDKRQARTAYVDSHLAYLDAEKKVAALDLIGEVTQTFITTMSLQEKLDLAKEATALAQSTFNQVQMRAKRGVTPEAEALRAKAALARARLKQANIGARYESSKVLLASYWGAKTLSFNILEGDLYAFSDVPAFEVLLQRVNATPAIARYASEQRVREAEMKLAVSQSKSDVRWQVGIKRFEATDDNAFTLGVSVPLFAEKRNQGNVQSALAAKNQVKDEKQAALLSLRARLFSAYTTRQQQYQAYKQLQQDVLPLLKESLILTQQAYEKGAYGYVDWVIAQQELLNGRMALVDAATSVLLNQALIEQLTAQPLAIR
ncbi:TolC family protein [Alteromonas sp. C1M14]|uniref:TolC family protein n=1 Tax=Alteromonas sp. C1M14 TaxID=2841567 RepID=UPI001C09A6DF|nr:TolC family protein [Alteromonas sp. C1M14]MBU2976881.1 TolC family protein [Alteromonas sp. C1M14]